MTRSSHITIILNPASAGGKTGVHSREIHTAICKHLGLGCLVHVTSRRGEAHDLARTAALNGCRLLVVVGGDGTVNEVLNGVIENGKLLNPECQIGIVSCGTGQGLARSLGLPLALNESVQAITEGPTRTIDIGRIVFQGSQLNHKERYFVSECQVGIGAEVVRRTPGLRKRLGGKAAYGLTTISTALSYPAQKITVEIDGRQRIARPLLGISISNGARTAGGMRLTPDARLDDGQLDLLLIHETSVLRRLREFTKIYAGTHVHSSGFTCLKAKRISLRSANAVPVAVDGEVIGALPCTIGVLPAMLRVRSSNVSRGEHHADCIEEVAEV